MTLATIITLIIASILFFCVGPFLIGLASSSETRTVAIIVEIAFFAFMVIMIAIGGWQLAGTDAQGNFLGFSIMLSLILGWAPIWGFVSIGEQM